MITAKCSCGVLKRTTYYLLRDWSICDFDLLRQCDPVGSFPAWTSRNLACPHPSGHGAPSTLSWGGVPSLQRLSIVFMPTAVLVHELDYNRLRSFRRELTPSTWRSYYLDPTKYGHHRTDKHSGQIKA